MSTSTHLPPHHSQQQRAVPWQSAVRRWAPAFVECVQQLRLLQECMREARWSWADDVVVALDAPTAGDPTESVAYSGLSHLINA